MTYDIFKKYLITNKQIKKKKLIYIIFSFIIINLEIEQYQKIQYIEQQKQINKQKIMQINNNAMYIDSNYTPIRSNNRIYYQQSNKNYDQFDNRSTKQRYTHKTQQRKLKTISPLAIKSVNQEIYQIIHMDQYLVQENLKISAKKIFGMINNQLLSHIKSISSLKLFLYNIVLMYIDQASRNYQEKIKAKQKQKSHSISSAKNSPNLRQKDISSKFQQITVNSRADLQNYKQTMPLIPKDKSKPIKNTQSEMIERQLTNKIQSTRESLEFILKKIQHYANYKLNGQDIMKLKKSVMDVSQLKPSSFMNLHTLYPTPNVKSQKNSLNRPLSRQSSKIFNSTQKNSPNRNDSRAKTYGAGFISNTSNSRVDQSHSGDQANQLLIQQLQQIIQRKQNRIKQLTKQLSKNLQDQKQLQNTIQNFEIQVQQIQNQRKNYQEIIEKLQEQNLNYQIEIKELKQTAIVKREVEKTNIQHSQQTNQSNWEYIKQMEKRQKMMKLFIRKQIEMSIQNKSNNSISEQKWKQINSLSQGSHGFNDISQITPKRAVKKMVILQNQQLQDEYETQITTRKNIVIQNSSNNNKTSSNSKSKPQKTNPNNSSFNKFQILTDKTKKASKFNTSGQNTRQDFKQLQKQNFQKILFLQALTIQQLLQDI